MKAQDVDRIHQATGRPFSDEVCRLSALAGVALALLCPSPVRAFLAEYQTAVTNEPSLISYYTFDQSDAADAKGTNHGTLLGSPGFAAGTGGFGTAVVLNGNNWVNLGVVEDFTFADTTGSAEAWVKAGTLNGAACIFANRDGYSRWDIHMNRDKNAIGMWNGAAYSTLSIPNSSTNWHHLVAVFDDGTWLLYWDGALAGSMYKVLGYTDTNKSTQIGCVSPYYKDSENWVGMVDEVAIYADALTPEAVQAHYEAFLAGNPPVITKQPKGGTYLPGAALTLTSTRPARSWPTSGTKAPPP